MIIPFFFFSEIVNQYQPPTRAADAASCQMSVSAVVEDEVEEDPDATLPPAVEPAEEARSPRRPVSSSVTVREEGEEHGGEEQQVCKISHKFVSFS